MTKKELKKTSLILNDTIQTYKDSVKKLRIENTELIQDLTKERDRLIKHMGYETALQKEIEILTKSLTASENAHTYKDHVICYLETKRNENV